MSQSDGVARMKHRFSSKRLHDLVTSLNDVQKGFVHKNGFGYLLGIKSFHVPTPLLEWVMEQMIADACEFRHRNKTIKFVRSLVSDIIGIPSGNVPIILDPKDPLVIRKVEEAKLKYSGGSKTSISEIAYMDHLDLDGHADQYRICYAVPRVCNVSSADFEFIAKFDRNEVIEGKVVYGIRDFRDAELTPYVAHPLEFPDCMNDVPSISGLGQHEAAPSSLGVDPGLQLIVSKYQKSLKQEIEKSVIPRLVRAVAPVFAKQMTLMAGEIFSFCQTLNNPSDVIPSDDVFVPQNAANTENPNFEHSNVIFSEQDNSDRNVNVSNDVDEHDSLGNSEDFHIHYRSSALERCLVSPDSDPTNATDSPRIIANEEDDELDNCIGPGLNIAMDFATESLCSQPFSGSECVVSQALIIDNNRTGTSTLEKQNRKKRHVRHTDDSIVVKLSVSAEAQELYEQYVVNKVHHANTESDSVVFVKISGFHCSYYRFHSSLHERGFIYDDLMAVFIQLFNPEYRKASGSSSSRKKIAFTPFFVSKVQESSDTFDAESVEAELTRINGDYRLDRCDLFFFPKFRGNHWVLVCINVLHKEVNFFDPADSMTSEDRDELLENVVNPVFNLCLTSRGLCSNAEIFEWNFTSYPRVYPSVPKQKRRWDCGIYVILYMLYFNGKLQMIFDEKEAAKFRKLLAHKCITSLDNEVDAS
ncbi:hypothetical protein EJB05_29227, partial [Eragrostis curvula]